jgi:hypothetical protein
MSAPTHANGAGQFARSTGSANCGTFETDHPRGYKRVSCSCGRAVVKQPWMNELNWMLAVQDFTIQHAAVVAGSSPNDGTHPLRAGDAQPKH